MELSDCIDVVQMDLAGFCVVGKHIAIVKRVPTKSEYSKYHKQNMSVLLFADPSHTYDQIRAAIEQHLIDGVCNLEYTSKQNSLHTTHARFDDVCAKLCAKHNIVVAASFTQLYSQENPHVALNKICYLLKLCNKFGVKFKWITLAKDRFELRNISDLESFTKVLLSARQFSSGTLTQSI